jgi:hypothetical protein
MIVKRFLITWADGKWDHEDSLQEAVKRIGGDDATIEDTTDGVVYTRKDFNEITGYLLLS